MKISSTDLFDLEQSLAGAYFMDLKYPWDILPKIKTIVFEIIETLPDHYIELDKDIWVGKNTSIEKNAVIQGPSIIGDDCQIRSSAYIRGNCIIGNQVVVGNSTEVKNAVLFNNVQVPHFNYVGDSVLGYKAHLGAGVILSNVRSIPGDIKVKQDGEVIDTKLRKFGAMIGDFAEAGCNSVLNPGTILCRYSVVYPLTSARGVIPPNSILKNSGEIVPRK